MIYDPSGINNIEDNINLRLPEEILNKSINHTCYSTPEPLEESRFDIVVKNGWIDEVYCGLCSKQLYQREYV